MADRLTVCKVSTTYAHELTGAYLPDERRRFTFWLQRAAHWVLKRYGKPHELTYPVYQFDKTTPKLEQAIFESAKALGVFSPYNVRAEVVLGRDAFEEFMQLRPLDFGIDWTAKVRYRTGREYVARIMDMPVAYYPHINGFAVLPLHSDD